MSCSASIEEVYRKVGLFFFAPKRKKSHPNKKFIRL
ncbi:hypothetical protein [Porphyromonas phage phage005b_ATCC49417]|uniref:Uncharacterized protein n=1 Tax=Porphyromonas phage phage005a_ATCC49417 TaxID=3154097 RepID=A0AAT9JBF5_9VIRU